MNHSIKHLYLATALVFSAITLSQCAHEPMTRMNAANSSSEKIASDSKKSLADLYASNPAARKMGRKAHAVLVFPSIVKGGFVFGAEGGNGALINSDGTVTRFYQTAGASYGLQAGAQVYSYALFLMHPSDLKDLDLADGWEVGASPSVVVVDQGMATSFSTTTGQKGVYAFFYDAKGLMAGISLKGSKITRIHPGS
jgi:lipid-binding SYLF domain-containing protein